MDAWLSNIEADTSDSARAVKVVRNKPPSLVDGCWTGSAAPFTFVAEPQFFGGAGTSSCNDLYPAAAFPRYVAGMPLGNDIAACRLRTVDVADYTVSFTPAEVARLHAIFPKGVCDYARTGFDQPDLLSTWLEYTGVGTYKKDRGPQK